MKIKSVVPSLFFMLFSLTLFIEPLSAANKKFSIITYNVAGLWKYISGSSPEKNTPLISQKLNHYDLCFFQEDFNYHKQLFRNAKHKYRSDHMDFFGWGSGVGDGLSRLSTVPFKDFRREKWQRCNGFSRKDGADCLTPKGFSFGRYHFDKDIIVDIYNLHADAGGTRGDHETRTDNIRQVLDRINQWSKGHAVIVVGDTNSRFSQKGEIRQLIDAGFSDAWVEKHNNGQVPSIGHRNPDEAIDKILFRSSKAVRLHVEMMKRLKTEFVDEEGHQLSDHVPAEAVFSYESGKDFRLLSSVGTRGANSFNDLTLISKQTVLPREVGFRVGDGIHQLRTVLTNADVLEHGPAMGTVYQLNLKTGEYIDTVEFCQKTGRHKGIASISITTNQGNHIAGGRRTTKCHQYKVPDGWVFSGFWGQETSGGITEAGLVIRHQKH